jgi:phosphoribosylamine-glycine ligase
MRAAQAAAYALASTISFAGAQYRRDIGHLAAAPEQPAAR